MRDAWDQHENTKLKDMMQDWRPFEAIEAVVRVVAKADKSSSFLWVLIGIFMLCKASVKIRRASCKNLLFPHSCPFWKKKVVRVYESSLTKLCSSDRRSLLRAVLRPRLWPAAQQRRHQARDGAQRQEEGPQQECREVTPSLTPQY